MKLIDLIDDVLIRNENIMLEVRESVCDKNGVPLVDKKYYTISRQNKGAFNKLYNKQIMFMSRGALDSDWTVWVVGEEVI